MSLILDKNPPGQEQTLHDPLLATGSLTKGISSLNKKTGCTTLHLSQMNENYKVLKGVFVSLQIMNYSALNQKANGLTYYLYLFHTEIWKHFLTAKIFWNVAQQKSNVKILAFPCNVTLVTSYHQFQGFSPFKNPTYFQYIWN